MKEIVCILMFVISILFISSCKCNNKQCLCDNCDSYIEYRIVMDDTIMKDTVLKGNSIKEKDEDDNLYHYSFSLGKWTFVPLP